MLDVRERFHTAWCVTAPGCPLRRRRRCLDDGSSRRSFPNTGVLDRGTRSMVAVPFRAARIRRLEAERTAVEPSRAGVCQIGSLRSRTRANLRRRPQEMRSVRGRTWHSGGASVHDPPGVHPRVIQSMISIQSHGGHECFHTRGRPVTMKKTAPEGAANFREETSAIRQNRVARRGLTFLHHLASGTLCDAQPCRSCDIHATVRVHTRL